MENEIGVLGPDAQPPALPAGEVRALLTGAEQALKAAMDGRLDPTPEVLDACNQVAVLHLRHSSPRVASRAHRIERMYCAMISRTKIMAAKVALDAIRLREAPGPVVQPPAVQVNVTQQQVQGSAIPVPPELAEFG